MRRTRGGFTLVELMVVIAILGVLMALILAVLPGVIGSSNAKVAKTDIQRLMTALDAYEGHFGAYPPSVYPGADASNTVNAGIESLVIALSYASGGGPYYQFDDDSRLGNRDRDKLTSTTDKLFGSYMRTQELLEYLDPFQQPFIYFNGADLNDTFSAQYQLGSKLVTVKPAPPSGKTGAYPGEGRYQIISVGVNLQYEQGGGDDVVSWAK